MCLLCGRPELTHEAIASFVPLELGGAESGGVAAALPTLPAGQAAQIAFLNGLTATNTVAATSFWTWNYDNPATYDSTSFAAGGSSWARSLRAGCGTHGSRASPVVIR